MWTLESQTWTLESQTKTMTSTFAPLYQPLRPIVLGCRTCWATTTLFGTARWPCPPTDLQKKSGRNGSPTEMQNFQAVLFFSCFFIPMVAHVNEIFTWHEVPHKKLECFDEWGCASCSNWDLPSGKFLESAFIGSSKVLAVHDASWKTSSLCSKLQRKTEEVTTVLV